MWNNLPRVELLMPILKYHTECTHAFSLSSPTIQDAYHTKDVNAYWRTCMLWSTFCKQVRLCREKVCVWFRRWFHITTRNVMREGNVFSYVCHFVHIIPLPGPIQTCSFGDPSSDLLKFVHYVAQTSIAKWALGLWLKGLLVPSVVWICLIWTLIF